VNGASTPARLLTVAEAAERLNTTERFVRRLVEERRIAFTRLGRHIRLAESDLDAFVAAGRVEPVRIRLRREWVA
jgi:excisionase family DNA binding protein